MNLPKLPSLLERKIYKTGQTRGSDDDVIFQNRVNRNSTVLIPYGFWVRDKFIKKTLFENGFIILIPPQEYFKNTTKEKLKKNNIEIGKNALVFYETRTQWNKYNPERLGWKPAQKRMAPLGGEYVARVPATTANESGEKIVRGFTLTTGKGAGIRVFEYADSNIIKQCRAQLEALFWLCEDSAVTAAKNGMGNQDIELRKKMILDYCLKQGLLDYKRLIDARVIDKEHITICPLCLEKLSGMGFFSRLTQAIWRKVPDLTVTEINLFHIEELRFGRYNHRPYNVGWGHHHCNIVVKDSGILNTLVWMSKIIKRNIDNGLLKI